MIRKLKRLLGLDIVEWVENEHMDYEYLEASEYLLVETKDDGQMLFTRSQVKRAKSRVPKQTENWIQ